MNSARKDGRSFGKARTFTEETEAIRTAIPSSTRCKNKWAVEIFKEWQYYRATKGETSSEVDDNVQTVDTPFQEMNGDSMAYWLGKFVQEVVRRDGQKYPSRSLYGIIAQASNLAAATAATGRRCPACWPLYPRNILKSTASSGLPSTTE
jgi:hypothetical protein